jgi:hypothetical protein
MWGFTSPISLSALDEECRRCCCLSVCIIFKLCLGINGIFYYAVTFFTEAGIEETKAKAGL